MSMAEFIYYGIYFAGALMLAIGLVIAVGVALAISKRYEQQILPMVLPIIGLAVAVSVILSKRNLHFIDLGPSGVSMGMQLFAQRGDPSSATWLLRLLTLFVVAISFALVFNYFYQRKQIAKEGRPLFLAFVVFFLTNTALNAALGTQPAFVHNDYYPLIILMAAYATRAHDPAVMMRFAKATLFGLLLASLALAVIKPSLVIQNPYVDGWIPGLHIRMWGVASHANSMGSLALMYLLLESHYPFQRRLLHYLGVAMALGILLLAQSKTAWVAGAILLAIVWFYRNAARFSRTWKTGKVDYQTVGIAIAAIAGALGLLVLMIFIDPGVILDKFLHTSSGKQMLSLSGRDQIWAVALDAWRENPLFGYGPKIWSPEFRQSIGMNFAFSAHNQFLQSLSGAGTFGMLGLLLYLGILLGYAIRFAKATQGLSLALGVFLLLRSFTETPLVTDTIFNGDFLVHLLVFSFLIRQASALARADVQIVLAVPLDPNDVRAIAAKKHPSWS
jgi:O-antigen ligase